MPSPARWANDLSSLSSKERGGFATPIRHLTAKHAIRRTTGSGRAVGHSENGELSLMGGLFKAPRCVGFNPTLVPTVSLVGGASCLRVLRFYFVRFCGCISPEKLFQMRIIEYDDGPVAFQREVMGSRIDEMPFRKSGRAASAC